MQTPPASAQSLWPESQPPDVGAGSDPEHMGPGSLVHEGQLSFGPQQGVLSEAERAPQQLPLLPEPPPWEEGPGSTRPGRSGKGRNARKHSRSGTSPGQVALF